MLRTVLDRHGTKCTSRDAGSTVSVAGSSLRTPLHRPSALRAVLLATVVLPLIVLGADPADAASAKPVPVPTTVSTRPTPKDEHMVVEADQVVYDNDADTVTALGDVHVYYKGNTLTAKKVTYLRGAKRVLAEGDARLVDVDGNVLTAPKLDVSEGFTSGFVESLRVDTIDRSRFAAQSATRSDGSVTVFEKGVYSACQTCVNEPEKPPFWQIKAAKIIHNQQEKMVYYEDARLEMLGVPIAYLPYFQHPDPSETRKSGFLLPRVVDSTTLGVGVQVPYYWAPVADWDATLAPVALSRQGFLMDLEVRHRFDNGGLVTVRGLGIEQSDPGAFVGYSGDRRQRGALLTTGRFDINDNWKWGWDGTFVTDRRFLSDYHVSPYAKDGSVSTLFLTGQGLQNYFDARLYSFTIFNDDLGYDKFGHPLLFGAGTELQQKQPIAAPVIDYDWIGEHPVAGGEISAHLNVTNLTRSTTDVDTYGRVLGIAGTFSRVSGLVGWRREVIDSIGQVWTPFASLRGDVFVSKNDDASTAPFVKDGTVGRFTPTIGLDYRYPFVAGTSFGTSTFAPIAQIVARPNEQWMGRLPNEDAQSVVFDDTTLFRPDKFSGWDRAEGGTRVNLGAEYTFQAANRGSISTLFGRSFLIAGENSFAYPDYQSLMQMAALQKNVPLAAFGSGLESNASDWVGRVTFDTANGFRVGAQGRFDNSNFALNRADIQATGTSGPLSAGIGWSFARTPQELYDLLDTYSKAGVPGAQDIYNTLQNVRSELQSNASLRLTPTWRVFGGVRYDVKNQFVSSDNIGVAYDNDSFSVSLSYTDSTYTALINPTPVTIGTVHDQTFFLRFGLRTLGDGQLSNSLSSNAN